MKFTNCSCSEYPSITNLNFHKKETQISPKTKNSTYSNLSLDLPPTYDAKNTQILTISSVD